MRANPFGVSGLVATGWSLASYATGLGVARSAHADLHCISVVVCHRDVVSSYCTRVITASSATDHLVVPASPECHPSSQFTSTRDPWSGAEARACLRASVAGLSHGCPRLSPLARAVAVGVRGARGAGEPLAGLDAVGMPRVDAGSRPRRARTTNPKVCMGYLTYSKITCKCSGAAGNLDFEAMRTTAHRFCC